MVDYIEFYSIPIRNIYGKDLGENDTFYYGLSSVRRTIEGVDMIPKTCAFWIICSEKDTGELEVLMEYTE